MTEQGDFPLHFILKRWWGWGWDPEKASDEIVGSFVQPLRFVRGWRGTGSDILRGLGPFDNIGDDDGHVRGEEVHIVSGSGADATVSRVESVVDFFDSDGR